MTHDILNSTSYDYIICGGGMSGLSLAFYLTNSTLNDKRILIIEPELKNKNDRTWAFWEIGESPFEDIVFNKWNKVGFVDSANNLKVYQLQSYNYKLIRGIDFYNYLNNHLSRFPNVDFLRDRVEAIIEIENSVIVKTKSGLQYKGDYVFDSTFKPDFKNPSNYNLLQHFMGWVIETPTDCFNTDLPEMMNFSIEQKNRECRFIYVIPLSKNKALVEFTIFSKELLSETQYELELSEFIIGKYKNYKILEQEFGIIPMSSVKIDEKISEKLIRIGTAGGYTIAATGYTFANTQRKLSKIVANLESNKTLVDIESFQNQRHKLYNATLLHVIEHKTILIAEVFDSLFEKNGMPVIMKFLDGETNLYEEMKIMWSTNKKKFIPAFLSAFKKSFSK